MVDWTNNPQIETNPEVVSGAPVFRGTRLPVQAVIENVDAFMELDGQSEDEAIASTLECYPETPGGAEGIRAVLDYRAAH